MPSDRSHAQRGVQATRQTLSGSTSPNWEDRYHNLHESYQALEAQNEILSTLREITLVINSTLELSEMLEAIVGVVYDSFEFRRITIFLLDPKKEVLQPAIARFGDDLITAERLQEEEFKLRENEYGDAIRNHRLVVVEDPRFESYGLVPLIARGEPVGLMKVAEKRSGEPLDDRDRSFLRLVASHISLAVYNAQLYAMAVTDGLTKLYVRRYFDLRMNEEFDQAQRYGRNFSLVLFDIDHFKSVNDTYGHITGDIVLRTISHLVSANVRRADVPCRYGGEEIAVILPETKLEESYLFAEKLRKVVEEHHFSSDSGQSIRITISLGVTEFEPRLQDVEAMVAAADLALYKAKESGRNCTVKYIEVA